MEWKTKPEIIKDREVRIGEVNVQPFYNDAERVQRIVFKTDQGDITFKPKMLEEEHRGGIKYTKLVHCKVDELPEIVKRIGVLIASRGLTITKATYMAGTMEKDGQEVMYRFVQGEKMLEQWEVCDNQNPLNTKEEVIK